MACRYAISCRWKMLAWTLQINTAYAIEEQADEVVEACPLKIVMSAALQL